MKIEEYSSLRDRYRMPERVECAGNAVDRERETWLSIGVTTRRDTYQEVGYLCHDGATQTFHACVCALLSQLKDMPIIKTVLLTPEDVFRPLCQEEEPGEELRYCADMALCALREALRGCLAMRGKAAAHGAPA